VKREDLRGRGTEPIRDPEWGIITDIILRNSEKSFTFIFWDCLAIYIRIKNNFEFNLKFIYKIIPRSRFLIVVILLILEDEGWYAEYYASTRNEGKHRGLPLVYNSKCKNEYKLSKYSRYR
jgi:hypothetical protein